MERRVLWAREALAAVPHEALASMPHPIPCLQPYNAFHAGIQNQGAYTQRPCMSQTLPLSCKPCCACKRAHETLVRAWARVRCFVAWRRCGEWWAEWWPLSHVC